MVGHQPDQFSLDLVDVVCKSVAHQLPLDLPRAPFFTLLGLLDPHLDVLFGFSLMLVTDYVIVELLKEFLTADPVFDGFVEGRLLYFAKMVVAILAFLLDD